MSQHDQQESDLPTELSNPARRALVGAGYVRLEHFARLSEAEVLQLPGRIFWGQDRVEVKLKRFNDRALNHDLEALCAKVAQEHPCLPDGRRLLLRVQGRGILHLDAQEKAVA